MEERDRHSGGKDLSKRLKMTRRSFVKLAAATAAATSLSAGAMKALAADESESTVTQDIQRVRSCCRACGKCECGVWVTIQDGKVIKTESDENSFGTAGNHCAKGQASLQSAYHPARLMYPMKRTGPKGQDPKWERISYDEAYRLATEGITSTQEKYGKECCFTMAGTSRIWAMGGYRVFPALYGTPNSFTADKICKGPRYVALKLNTGNSGLFWLETVARPRVYVQWGSAAELSNYDDAGRTIVDVATRADTYITVDPRQGNMGKEADIWVNLAVGTDGAVANSWAQVIIENELYDDFYVRKWMNAPYLVVEEKSFEPTVCGSTVLNNPEHNKTRLLKESDIVEGGSNTRFMVLNELTDQLSWYEAGGANPGWEGEDWAPATKGSVPHIPGIDLTGASPGLLLDYVPFPDGLFPALHTEEGGHEVTLKDGTVVHVRTVWERYIDFLEDYTPEKVSEIAGVSPETIRKAATTYATRVDPSTGYGNGSIHYTLAAEHACNCIQNQRACDLLGGMCGNMDTPGGARASTTGPFGEMIGNAGTTPSTSDSSQAIHENSHNSFELMGAGPAGGSDPTSVIDAINYGTPYPIKCGVGAPGDFLNQSNNLYTYEQLCKLDFFYALDVWHTPQVDGVADVVFPANHWLEMSAPRKSQGACGHIGATVKVIDPPGECRSDYEHYINLYKAMGEPFYAGETDAEKWPLDDPIYAICEHDITGFPPTDNWGEYVEQFQENGWWDAKLVYPKQWGTYRRYQTGGLGQGRDTSVKQGFATVTGKQEIWSTTLEAWWPDRGEEFPRWVPAPHAPQAEPERYEDPNVFLLTTGRRQGTYFHSEHRQIPFCRELHPAPRCEINPADAERLGIEQGDWVWIETDYNDTVCKIRQVADLYYGIAPGVANCEHSWWYPELEQADRGFKLSAVNCLVDQYAQDRIYGSSNLRSYAVKIYKATPENSPFNNPVPCGDDGTEIIHDASDPRLKEWAPVYEGRIS
jgi:anaerobic selenocysteine-containing dehydrogenase